MSAPLDILIIRDSRPGHYNQSEGIAKAIGRFAPAGVRYAHLRSRAILARRALYFLYNSGWAPDRLLALGDCVDSPARKPDLIISAGGETLLPNVMLARQYGCANIFSGSVRNLNPDFFSAILLPYRRFDGHPRYIIGLKPSPVDPDMQPANPVVADLCVLVGGPSGTHSFTEAEWHALRRLVEAAVQQMTVAVLTSRRTPQPVTAELASLARRSANLLFADFTQVGPGATFDYYAGAGAILVTEDSNSMLTEAICSRKPVLALAPKSRRMNADEAGYINDLEAKGWLARHGLDETLTLETVRHKLTALRPMPVNHLDLLAMELAKKIPFLQPAVSEAKLQ